MSDYKPGTVAYASVRGRSSYLVSRSVDGYWVSASKVDGRHSHHDDHVTEVRPLVVLDLSKRDAADLALWLRKQIRGAGSIAERVADQIEAQTRPPKPPEPQGLGAVVEDTEGRLYVRVDDPKYPWRDNGSAATKWREFDAVRVLSEGVQP